MTDRDFLLWIYSRLHFVHGEKREADYMSRLASIITAMSAEIVTANTAPVIDISSFTPPFEPLVSVARLAECCTGKRDRECLYRLAKEVAIIDQDFERALKFRALQSANRPRLPKGHRHAPRR